MNASHHSFNEGELQVDKISLICMCPFEGVIPEPYEFLVRELESNPLYIVLSLCKISLLKIDLSEDGGYKI